jgi:hypothetical protein
MTEAEWLVCKDPMVMLRHLGVDSNERKTLLLTCACLRRIEDLLPKDGVRWMVIAEAVAAGKASTAALPDESAETALYEAMEEGPPEREGAVLAVLDVFSVRWSSLDWTPGERPEPYLTADWLTERAVHADLVRDIFGSPFRLVRVQPHWLSRDVRALAHLVHDARTFERLPILTDALEDAGCDNADLLGHLRGPGPHVRGCWAVDLLLGKE